MNPLPYLQHFFEKFSGEIGLLVAGAFIAKTKDFWRWAQRRLRPDGTFPQLVIAIVRGRASLRGQVDGEMTVTVQFVNLSTSEIVLTHCQVSYWEFNGHAMATPDTTIRPLRVVIPRTAIVEASVTIRLHARDVAAMRAASNVAPNIWSAPANRVRLLFTAVIDRRFGAVNLEGRYLESEALDITLPDDAPSP